MDADARPILSADELVAVIEIADSRFQTTLMDRVLASTEQHKIPEESFIRLLQIRDRKFVRVFYGKILGQILDKRAVTLVTTAMLASAYNVATLTLLLDYDPLYVVTSATIDAFDAKWDDFRDCVEALLLRDPSLYPTESQVCKVLTAKERQHSRSVEDDEKIHVLDLMFSRNASLNVTQEMLETVRDPGDLKVLLAHMDPGKQFMADAVLASLVPPCRPDDDIASASSSEFSRRSDEDDAFTSSS
jgi:hypothetical protein